jgi:hypothetical protein
MVGGIQEITAITVHGAPAVRAASPRQAARFHASTRGCALTTRLYLGEVELIRWRRASSERWWPVRRPVHWIESTGWPPLLEHGVVALAFHEQHGSRPYFAISGSIKKNLQEAGTFPGVLALDFLDRVRRGLAHGKPTLFCQHEHSCHDHCARRVVPVVARPRRSA